MPPRAPLREDRVKSVPADNQPALRLPTMRGRTRCKLHGGKNPGAPLANANALVHGKYGRATVAAKRAAAAVTKQDRGDLAVELDGPVGQPRASGAEDEV